VIFQLPLPSGRPSCAAAIGARAILGFLALCLFALCPHRALSQAISATIPTSSIAWAVAVNPATNKVYVVNYAESGRVTVIDGATNATTVVPVGSYPVAVAVNSTTNKVYVANSGSDSVTVIDGATNSTTTVPVGQNPTQLIVNQTNNTVYVLNASLLGTVMVIDGSTDAVTDSIWAGYDPSIIAVDTATNQLFVSAGSNSDYQNVEPDKDVYSYNGGSGSATDNGSVAFSALVKGIKPFSLGADPATGQLVVTATGGFGIELISLANGEVTSSHFYAAGWGPVAFDSATGFAYVGDLSGQYLHVINCSNFKELILPVGYHVAAVAVDESANAVYTVEQAAQGSVAAVDRLTNAITILPVYPFPNAIAVNPVTHKVYALNSDAQGTVTVIDGIPAMTIPTVSGPPQSQTVAAGSTVAFNVAVTGRPTPTYQWTFNGAPLSDGGLVSGTQGPTLVISGADPSSAGAYACVVTNSSGSVTSREASLTVVTSSDPGRIVNLSTRADIESQSAFEGAHVLIAGFVVGGTGSKRLVLRGIGPTLADFGLADAVDQTALTLFDSASPANIITQDSGWQSPPAAPAAPWSGVVLPLDATSADFSQVGAFALPSPSGDSAVSLSLPPGAYTSQVKSADAGTGVVLAEVYDEDTGASGAHLTNISSRALIDNVGEPVIAGFVIGGQTSQTVLIRASGPALGPFGVDMLLPYPNVLLFDSAGNLLGSNTAWGGSPQIAAAAEKVGAFPWTDPSSTDSALLVTLAPGSYTAEVNPTINPFGNVLIEVYAVP
jgi:YVTN family beta-propeller protein